MVFQPNRKANIYGFLARTKRSNIVMGSVLRKPAITIVARRIWVSWAEKYC
jgi:hypothetical protein